MIVCSCVLESGIIVKKTTEINTSEVCHSSNKEGRGGVKLVGRKWARCP